MEDIWKLYDYLLGVMTWPETLYSFLTGSMGGALVVWFANKVLAERVRAAIQHEYATKLETYKADLQADITRRLDQLRAEAEEKGRLQRERWQIKRESCLRALDIIDRVLTNILWSDQNRPDELVAIKRLPVDTQEARDVMNRLILSCDHYQVVVLFLKAIGINENGETSDPDLQALQELRNVIRKELGFGEEIYLPSDIAWLSFVLGDDIADVQSNQKDASVDSINAASLS
ncbi:hypothetical protein [Nitrosomonas nitrosa]|uniref:hypothetical protein n=1 Tax=Nitrosomonas nitrosa TaxID=52442 RepID=UPI0023F88BCF|nr:hypothetical protein [Nitrosomonas nitrosa]MCO6433795.1 hypothetical protein [Nitrosomonas nitrosa]